MITRNHFQTIRQLLKQLDADATPQQQPIIQQITNTFKDLELQLASSSETSITSPNIPTLDQKSGCYRFENDPNFYCPHCFDRDQYRSATQRINSKLRVCTRCRSSLKPVTKS